MTRLLSHSTLLVVALIWGVAFVFQAKGLQELGPFAFVAFRFIIGAFTILPVAFMEWRKRPISTAIKDANNKNANTIIGIIALSGVMAIGSLMQQVSLGSTSVANAAFLTTLYVPFVPLLGLFIFRHNINPYRWGAVAIFILGSWLMTGYSASGITHGDIIVIISAVFWASHIMLVGAMAQRTNAPFQLAFIQTTATAILATMLMLMFETVSFDRIVSSLPDLLFTGVLSTGIAFTLQLVAQRYASSVASALLLSTESIIAAIAGWIILSQMMTSLSILGASLIFCAVLIVELKPDKPPNKPIIKI